MTGYQKLTAAELRDLVIAQLRMHRDCDHVADVIIEPIPNARPNWKCSWVMADNRLRPAKAEELAEQIRHTFDLA